MSYQPRALTGTLFRAREGDGYAGKFLDGTAEHRINGSVETIETRRQYRLRIGTAGTAVLTAATPSSDKAPSHAGEMTLDGKAYELSAWLKTSAQGTRYFSLSARPIAAASVPRPRAERRPSQKKIAFANAEVGHESKRSDDDYDPADFDDPIPF